MVEYNYEYYEKKSTNILGLVLSGKKNFSNRNAT